VKREAILVAAARVFAEKGYGRTTIQEVLDESGATKGALYHYFANKQELAQALVTEYFTMEDSLPLLPRVQSVVDASIKLALLTAKVPVIQAAARLVTEPDHPFFLYMASQYIDTITALLAEAAAFGELRRGVEPREAAATWVEAYTGADVTYRLRISELPDAIARMNLVVARGLATEETMQKVDTSVARGERLIQQSRWAGDFLNKARVS
jgi:AcrR family transcriptional regulator